MGQLRKWFNQRSKLFHVRWGCRVQGYNLVLYRLTHWGRATHICVGKLTIIGSDNGLSPGRRQAIIWTNAGILLIGPLGTNLSEILIGIQTFSFRKMHLKISSEKWRPFCLGLNELKWNEGHVCTLSSSAGGIPVSPRYICEYCMGAIIDLEDRRWTSSREKEMMFPMNCRSTFRLVSQCLLLATLFLFPPTASRERWNCVNCQSYWY